MMFAEHQVPYIHNLYVEASLLCMAAFAGKHCVYVSKSLVSAQRDPGVNKSTGTQKQHQIYIC